MTALLIKKIARDHGVSQATILGAMSSTACEGSKSSLKKRIYSSAKVKHCILKILTRG